MENWLVRIGTIALTGFILWIVGFIVDWYNSLEPNEHTLKNEQSDSVATNTKAKNEETVANKNTSTIENQQKPEEFSPFVKKLFMIYFVLCIIGLIIFFIKVLMEG